MKTRILFVDDDSLVLQGLQRMLRNMRNEWEMEFVDSGSRALERMAQTLEVGLAWKDQQPPKRDHGAAVCANGLALSWRNRSYPTAFALADMCVGGSFSLQWCGKWAERFPVRDQWSWWWRTKASSA